MFVAVVAVCAKSLVKLAQKVIATEKKCLVLFFVFSH